MYIYIYTHILYLYNYIYIYIYTPSHWFGRLPRLPSYAGWLSWSAFVDPKLSFQIEPISATRCYRPTSEMPFHCLCEHSFWDLTLCWLQECSISESLYSPSLLIVHRVNRSSNSSVLLFWTCESMEGGDIPHTLTSDVSVGHTWTVRKRLSDGSTKTYIYTSVKKHFELTFNTLSEKVQFEEIFESIRLALGCKNVKDTLMTTIMNFNIDAHVSSAQNGQQPLTMPPAKAQLVHEFSRQKYKCGVFWIWCVEMLSDQFAEIVLRKLLQEFGWLNWKWWHMMEYKGTEFERREEVGMFF